LEKNLIFDLWGEISCILVEINQHFQAGFSGVVYLYQTTGQWIFLVPPMISSDDFINWTCKLWCPVFTFCVLDKTAH